MPLAGLRNSGSRAGRGESDSGLGRFRAAPAPAQRQVLRSQVSASPARVGGGDPAGAQAASGSGVNAQEEVRPPGERPG